jgi:hypothetical protein
MSHWRSTTTCDESESAMVDEVIGAQMHSWWFVGGADEVVSSLGWLARLLQRQLARKPTFQW